MRSAALLSWAFIEKQRVSLSTWQRNNDPAQEFRNVRINQTFLSSASILLRPVHPRSSRL